MMGTALDFDAFDITSGRAEASGDVLGETVPVDLAVAGRLTR